METKNFELYLYVSYWTEDNKPQYAITDYDRSPYSDENFTHKLLKKFEIEVEIPHHDPLDDQVTTLEARIKKEMADSQVRVNLLKDRISNLLAIGYEKKEPEKFHCPVCNSEGFDPMPNGCEFCDNPDVTF